MKNCIYSATYLLILNVDVVFPSVFHRWRAHRLLRADKAVSWWVYTCHMMNMTAKELLQGPRKQRKEAGRTNKQARTQTADISLHAILNSKKTTAMNPTKPGTLSALVHCLCHMTSFLLGQVRWTWGTLQHHNAYWNLPVTPLTGFVYKLSTLKQGIY